MPLPPPGSDLFRLMTQFPRAGRVQWIGVRPARDVAVQEVDEAEATAGGGSGGQCAG